MPPFHKRWPFLLRYYRKRFLFKVHKYSKNFNKSIVKNNFSHYNNFYVRKHNMNLGGEIT
jgi:hypothetical protein